MLANIIDTIYLLTLSLNEKLSLQLHAVEKQPLALFPCVTGLL